MTTPLAIDFLVLQCAELQQLQLDAMSEPTTPTLPTSPSLSRKTWQNNLTNKAHVAETSLAISDGLWRSLTISDDLMGCIRTYGASSCSCATSWSFSESWDPAFQTRAQLDADLCKCQCCDMLRPTLPSSTTAVNVCKHEMTQKWVQTTRATVLESGRVQENSCCFIAVSAASKPASHR